MQYIVKRQGPQGYAEHGAIVESQSGYFYLVTVIDEFGGRIARDVGPGWTYRTHEVGQPPWHYWLKMFDTSGEWGGFAAGTMRMSYSRRDAMTYGRVWWVHYSLATTASSLLPLAWVASHARGRRRERLGLCPACGYDLRARPGRCPECGAVPLDAPA